MVATEIHSCVFCGLEILKPIFGYKKNIANKPIKNRSAVAVKGDQLNKVYLDARNEVPHKKFARMAKKIPFLVMKSLEFFL